VKPPDATLLGQPHEGAIHCLVAKVNRRGGPTLRYRRQYVGLGMYRQAPASYGSCEPTLPGEEFQERRYRTCRQERGPCTSNDGTNIHMLQTLRSNSWSRCHKWRRRFAVTARILSPKTVRRMGWTTSPRGFCNLRSSQVRAVPAPPAVHRAVGLEALPAHVCPILRASLSTTVLARVPREADL
jgi:hypothetical protein